MIDKSYTYAVVGASNDSKKYGHRALKSLLSAGFRAIPVNPNESEILDQRAYPKLSQIPEKPDVAVFVVHPTVTLELLKEVKKLGIDKVWMQPGSESPEAEEFLKTNGIQFVSKACIIHDREDYEG